MMKQSSTFTIDDVVMVEGIHNPEDRWNGFATPHLQLESALEFLQQTQVEEKKYFDEGISYEVNMVARILTTWSAECDWPEEWDIVELKGYTGLWVALGSHCWTWTEVQ